MSEKRFVWDKDLDRNITITDTKTNRVYDKYSWEELEDVLNELYDENRELLKKVNDWKFVNDFQEKEIDGLKEALKEKEYVEDENEQLRKDCTILVQSNQEYRKENEQLKEQLKWKKEEIKTLLEEDDNDE